MSDIEILEDFIDKVDIYFDDDIGDCAITSKIAGIIENLIQENKELKEKQKELYSENLKLNSEIASSVYWLSTPTKDIEKQFIPKSKVRELAKKYEFALNGYDSSTADYKHSQNLGRYLACIELLKEGE